MSFSAADDAPRPPVRRRFPSRLTMGFAVLSSVVLVFCCVPMVILQIMLGPKEIHEPADVVAQALDIAPVVLPANFQGTIARRTEGSLLQLVIARLDHEEGRGRLILGRCRMSASDAGNELETLLLQNMVDNLYPGQRSIDAKPQTRTVNSPSGPLEFEYLEGEDRASVTRLKQISGVFHGPQGTLQVLLQAEAEFVSDESINELIHSVARSPFFDPGKNPPSAEKD